MSTYQSYDFVKDVNFHLSKNLPINLSTKSDIFKIYLFKLKMFQLNERIKENHPLFEENYFLFSRFNKVFIAKKLENDQFHHIEILDGIKTIRKMKLKKLYK